MSNTYSQTYDGMPNVNNVTNFGSRKLHAKVIDNVLNQPAYASRLMAMAKPFPGTTYDYNVKVLNSNTAETFVGLQNLNVSASDNNIVLSFSQANVEIPITIPLDQAIANAESEDKIDLNTCKYEEAEMEMANFIGNLVYGVNTDNFLGLNGLIDDGTSTSTLGGQSRTTWTQLNSKVTASGGTLSLAKLDALDDNISDQNVDSEMANINLTDFNTFSLYGQLINPSVRQDVGYQMLGINASSTSIMTRGDLKGGAGFTVLTYRGFPVIRDKFCTAGTWFMINERYLMWRGRSKVPTAWSDVLEKVDLGKPSTIEGPMNAPSNFHGFFRMKPMMIPANAGKLERIFLFGQLMTSQGRRHGKLTGINSI